MYLWYMLDSHRIYTTVDLSNVRCTDHPNLVIKTATRHGARHGKTEAQREYKQAKDFLRKAIKNKYCSILQRFQQSEMYSQQAIGWDEETCRRLDSIVREDDSYIATWNERRR